MSVHVGLAAFGDSLRLVRRKGIRGFVWAPATISLVLIVSGLRLTWRFIDSGVQWLLDWLPGWLDFLSYILTPLAYLLSAAVAAWTFSYLATILVSPFLGVLAARVETELTGIRPADGQSVVSDALATLARELRKLCYHLPRLIGVFLASLLPGINLVAPLLWVGFGAWIVAVQFADFAAENRRLPFPGTLQLLRGDRAAALGFGAPTFALLSVPVLNFIMVPLAVVGGTALYCRLKALDLAQPP